jgi:4'-phosphopantetheinyl transferase
MIDGVHIWRAALDEAGWPGPERLPAHERDRASSFLREEACRRWVAARWALRRVLAGYLDEPPAAIEIELGRGGKPRLRGSRAVEFNLSHSGGLALVAVTEGREIGVDVEMVDPGRDLADLARRALPEDAVLAVEAAREPERAAVFYAAWTRHEASVKCLGTGLAGNGGRRPSISGGRDRRLDEPAVENLDVAPGYAAAVAVAAPEVGPVDCRSLRAG